MQPRAEHQAVGGGASLARALAFCCFAFAALACTQKPSGPRNLILISIDTLRADRLGSYGYDRPTSPYLDRFAGHNVRFAHVTAESSWTLPSHMSMFTGLTPSRHGVIRSNKRLGDRVPTLAQILSRAGFRTRAVTCGGNVADKWGLEVGFETYDSGNRPLDDVLRAGRAFVESVRPDERYFLFLHTYAVHTPRDPPAADRQRFVRQPNQDFAGATTLASFADVHLTDAQMAYLSDLYDASICHTDRQIGGFFDWLQARGALADTIVAVVSDHGEQFGEHGHLGHGTSLYIETLQVPLIVHAPGFAPAAVEEPGGLADLMPTLLDLLGVAKPALEGRSLVPAMRGVSAGAPRPLFSRLDRDRPWKSVTLADLHLIDEDGQSSLFDLRKDPHEQRPLDRPAPARVLRALLTQHEQSNDSKQGAVAAELSSGDIERLRALGYE